MSMTMLTVYQLAGVLVLYTLLTVMAPALVFHNKVTDKRPLERFFIYFTIGNFTIMNIVFILQLLHISNRITLIVATVLPAVIIYIRGYRGDMPDRIIAALETLEKALTGKMGWKTFFKKCRTTMAKHLADAGRFIRSQAIHHFFEWAGFLILAAALVWMYGRNSLNNYGYQFSDIPVHNYWINSMGDNDIFVAGVYPFGFHCIIYYMHAVFGIDTYVLLRVFGLTQTLYIHLVLFFFMRGICRSKYAPYAASAVYILYDILNAECTRRYSAALPQEFGMLFILPSIYFALRFLAVRKDELKQEEKVKGMSDSSWYLAGYAMNFAMTLAVHFYDTMIAGLFCAALAIAFFFRIFNIHYLWRIAVAVIAAVLIGALPMVIAFATGTPLQGSLGWGMNVIQSGSKSNENVTQEAVRQPEQIETQSMTQGATQQPEQSATQGAAQQPGQSAMQGAAQQPEQTKTQSVTQAAQQTTVPIQDRLKSAVRNAYNAVSRNIRLYVIKQKVPDILDGLLICMGAMLVIGIIMMLCRQIDYGAQLHAVVWFILILLLLLASGSIGLPKLMDENRCRIYLTYMMPILMALALDSVLVLIRLVIRYDIVMNVLSLLVFVAVMAGCRKLNMLRTPIGGDRLETNGAITCLTNIIKQEKDNTWTIVSANDELRMIDKHGYHYEPITFLRTAESNKSNKDIYIDTPYVYFYIEKIPLDYTVHYAGSGQRVSETGASRKLPDASGLGVYSGENRWIVMSKMYYWAQRFRKLYPQEMQIYYEDEEFICYRLTQNMYSLYNMAID